MGAQRANHFNTFPPDDGLHERYVPTSARFTRCSHMEYLYGNDGTVFLNFVRYREGELDLFHTTAIEFLLNV